MPHILVIDSGAGGLSIAQSILEHVTFERVSYVTDSAYFPYGEKAPEQLESIVLSLLQLALETLDPPDVIVIACNTASTRVLQQVRQQTAIPIVGVVPAIKPAGQISRTGVFGVLATPSTIKSRYLLELKEEFCPATTMICHGSTPLVQLAESFVLDQWMSSYDKILQELQHLFSQDSGDLIDTLVLACTHFPLVSKVIHSALPRVTSRPVQLVDSGIGVALQVGRLVESAHNGKRCDAQPKLSFYNRHKKDSPLESHRSQQQYARYLAPSA